MNIDASQVEFLWKEPWSFCYTLDISHLAPSLEKERAGTAACGPGSWNGKGEKSCKW